VQFVDPPSHPVDSLQQANACTLCVKKQCTWLLITTSVNVDQFLKFFHWQIPKKTFCIPTAKLFISS